MYKLVWIRSPLTSKGNAGPGPFQQNALHSVTESLDHLSVEIKYPGLYYSLLLAYTTHELAHWTLLHY